MSFLVTGIKNYVNSYSGLSKTCWHGLNLCFIESTLIGIYYFLPLYFVNELKFSELSAGAIISCYGIGSLIGGWGGGKLCDKFSASLVCAISLATQTIVIFNLTKLDSAKLIMLDLFVMGVASYAFILANQLWVLQQCEQSNLNKLTAVNVLSVASNLGIGISALIISLFHPYGLKNLLYFCSLGLLFATFYFLSIDISTASAKSKMNSITEDNPGKENQMTFVIVLICVFCAGLIIFQSNTTYSFFIKNQFPSWGLSAIGVLFAINSFMIVFFQTLVGNWTNSFNKLLLIGLGLFLLGFGYTILNFSNYFFICIFGMIIHTLGEILFFSVSLLLCYENCLIKTKGKILGLYRSVYASSRIIAPVFGTIIFQRWGCKALWTICGLIGIVGFAICYLKQHHKKLVNSSRILLPF